MAIGAGVAISVLAVIILFPSVIANTFNSIAPPAPKTNEDTLIPDDMEGSKTIALVQPEPQKTITKPAPPVIPTRTVPDLENVAEKIHDLVNEHRRDNGLAKLSYDDDLALVALGHSEDMAENNFFDHVNLVGQDPSARADTAGYSCHKELGDGWYTEGIAENIAQNFLHSGTITYLNGAPHYTWLTEDQLAQSIFTQWKHSPGHNENMLGEDYDREGLGIAIGDEYEVYATQNFC